MLGVQLAVEGACGSQTGDERSEVTRRNSFSSVIHPNDGAILLVPNNSCGYINDSVVCNYTRNRLLLSTVIPQVLQLLMQMDPLFGAYAGGTIMCSIR